MKSVTVTVRTNQTYGMSNSELETFWAQEFVPGDRIVAKFSAFTHADAICAAMKMASEQQPVSFDLEQGGYGYSYETDGEQLELTGKWEPVERSERSYFYGGWYE